MIEGIISTKLYMPHSRTDVVQRPRLNKKLEHGIQGSLVLVSAPAGFGKSTAISSWLEDSGRNAAWFSIDDGDNDPAVFLTYFTAALAALEPSIGTEILKPLLSSSSVNLDKILIQIINDTAGLKSDIILVIDDYHLISSEAVHEKLLFLINHIPHNLHLVISTREDPPFKLARQRASGLSSVISSEELRFKGAEVKDFLSGAVDQDITDDVVFALERKCEGWITGLKLDALALTESGNDIRAVKQPYIIDYLVEEVISRQSGPVQEFLLKTSVLDDFCAPLCDAVVKSSSGTGYRMLEKIGQLNLFIVPMDDEGRWFRYHHLFRDALYHNLQKNNSDYESLITEIYKAASLWYEQNDFYDEAFRYAVAAKDYEAAVRIVSDDNIPIHIRRMTNSLINLLEALPNSVFNKYPILMIELCSLKLGAGRTEGVKEQLDTAEALIMKNKGSENSQHLLGRIAAGRSTYAFAHYNFEEILIQAQRALELLDERDRSISARITALWTKANALEAMGKRREAVDDYDKALLLSRKAGAVFFIGINLIGRAMIHEYDCNLSAAEQLFRQAVEVFAGQAIPVVSEAYLGLARILYKRNELVAADDTIKKSLMLTMLYEDKMDRYIISEILKIRLRLAENAVGEASAMLAEVYSTAKLKNFKNRIKELESLRQYICLVQGFIDEAEQQEMPVDIPDCRIRILIAKKRIPEALSFLKDYKAEIIRKEFREELLQIEVIEAVALFLNNEKDSALKILEAAVNKAESSGFIRIFIDEGAVVKRLLTELAKSQTNSEFINEILAAFPPVPVLNYYSEKDDVLIESLSHRELEILHLIASGLSNIQIAKKLNLAIDTVKGHNRNIFSKLQANRRTEAVARARELGIINN